MRAWEVGDMSCDEVREYLRELIEALDDLEADDYFGSEGWENMLMGDR